jgi:glycosyltransferase involved in cell wall biosynthesis
MLVFAGKHFLIIVENLPLPFDRRVWQEATTLRENGAEVSIICPQMNGYTKSYEVVNGIKIYRHPLPIEGVGALGYFIEYINAIFWQCYLSWKIYLKKRFHVIQGCNPPDLIFITAMPFKLLGVKYIFDHHDINPELYIAKFDRKGLFYHLMVIFEKLTFMFADESIATNESYKKIAIDRGGMDSEKVTVVRSGPKLDRLKIGPAVSEHKCGKAFLLGYVGVIGEQEGLDLLLKSLAYIKSKRNDVHLAIVGGGTELDKIKMLAAELEIDDCCTFYGRVSDEVLVEVLNTADVCVNPDRPTEMNNLSTMNKIMEYMSLKKPIVQFDLKEGRYSAGKASLYAKNTCTKDFANKVIELLEDEPKRAIMAEYGYRRLVEELSWSHEEMKLVGVYKSVIQNHREKLSAL